MRKIKFITLITCILLMMSFSFQSPVMACSKNKKTIKYVTIGDSIAYGVGASSPEKSYTGLFSEFLSKKYKSYSFENMTIPGITSTQLLAQLTNPEALIASIPQDYPMKDYATNVCRATKSAIETADIITISIGGNNLLEGFDLENGKIDFDVANKGISDFSSDWPKIIQVIKTLNPDVKILAMTVYNPFKADDEIYAPADSLIKGINATITKGVSKGKKKSYTVADVYKEFLKCKDITKLTHFYESYDVHPSDKGYELIYKSHKKAYK